MKRKTPLIILFLSIFLSCATNNREDLMMDYYSDIQSDHSRWQEVLENYNKDSTSIEELNRLFFYYNQKPTFERKDVRLVLKFFDIDTSDSIFLEYTKLIDRKNSLVVGFYLHRKIREDELLKLLVVENEIVTVLEKIEDRILNE